MLDEPFRNRPIGSTIANTGRDLLCIRIAMCKLWQNRAMISNANQKILHWVSLQDHFVRFVKDVDFVHRYKTIRIFPTSLFPFVTDSRWSMAKGRRFRWVLWQHPRDASRDT